MSTRKQYDRRDIGCIADGALGHQHCREVLADWLAALDVDHPGEAQTKKELCIELHTTMSDDAQEEYDALDFINEYADGVYFTFDNGDLVCLPTDKNEEVSK